VSTVRLAGNLAGKRGLKKNSNGVGANGASAEASPAKTVAMISGIHEERLRTILHKIEFEPPCRIHDLALEFNLSQSHLQHLFKQQTGLCLGHLLTEQRLERAAYLLTHSHLRIKEIACAVGYEHTSSFIRAFERRFSQAPLVYRNKNHDVPQKKLTKSRFG
jgi:transcriptional regulator GlxA family with amidase domain